MTHRIAHFVCASTLLTALLGACFTPAALAQVQSRSQSQPQPQSTPLRDQLHANAVASFQQRRFPEAYGRFMALADAGHPPAAEMALFLALNGNAVYGKDWDVTPEQLADWVALTGRPAPVLQARSYPQPRQGAGGLAKVASR